MKNYYEEKVKTLVESSKDYAIKSAESEKILSPKSAWKGLVDLRSSDSGLNLTPITKNKLTTSTTKTVIADESATWTPLNIKLKAASEINSTPPFCVSQADREIITYASEYLLGFSLSDLVNPELQKQLKDIAEKFQNMKDPAENLFKIREAVNQAQTSTLSLTKAVEESHINYEKLRNFFSLNYYKLGVAVVATALGVKILFIGGPAAVPLSAEIVNTMPSFNVNVPQIPDLGLKDFADTTLLYTFGLFACKIVLKVLTRGRV
jgi:hypothetical protein